LAAGSTYTPIATTTLGSAAASYTFSSIPSTYTDLILIVNGYTNHTGNQQIYFQPNADAGSNYSWTRIYGDGTSAGSDRATSVGSGASGASISNSSSDISTVIFNILNYANTTTYKTTLYRSNIAGAQVNAGVQLWRSTAAISSLKLAIPNSTYATGTTFTLYGIASA